MHQFWVSFPRNTPKLNSITNIYINYDCTVYFFESKEFFCLPPISPFPLSQLVIKFTVQLSVLFSYFQEHLNIIFSITRKTEIIAVESQNPYIKVSITWISSFEIPDKPPCCVRQCGTSFFYSRDTCT